MLVRAFNQRGIEQFRAFLDRFQEGDVSPNDSSRLVTNLELSSLVEPRVNIDIPALASKRRLAQTICEAFEKSGYSELPIRNSVQTQGMWTWLAAAAFRVIRSRRISMGRPKLNNYTYYILNPDFRHLRNHRVAAPARIYWLYRDRIADARMLLHGHASERPRTEYDLAETQRWLMNRELVSAATTLYFEPTSSGHKRGSLSDDRPGTLRRFLVLMRQLEVTYDLQGMSANQIIDLLPPEFNRWKK